LFPPSGPRLVGIARLAAQGPLLEAKRDVEYHELPSRSLLNRCSSPRVPFQWTINPYRGCEFGCKYCYARYTHEFMELRQPEDFEDKIFAKQFDPRLLRDELKRVKAGDQIALGTATDPYQPAERRFGITRRVLEAFGGQKGCRLSITSKSDLVVRDIPLLQRIARANVLHVNITITTTDAGLARLLEPRAPRPELRLEAVRRLAESGISVGVFPNPIMPLLTDTERNLDAVAAAAASAGAKYLAGGILFLKPCAQAVFLPLLEQRFPRLVRRYRERFSESGFLRGAYPEMVKERLARIRARHGLAASPADYSPEDWPAEPQGELFPAGAA
jgi:DNA repair photolyase